MTNQDLEQRQKLVLVGLKKAAEHQLKSNWDLRIFTFIQAFIQLAVSIHPFNAKCRYQLYECLFKGIISRNKRRFYSNNGCGGLAGTNLGI